MNLDFIKSQIIKLCNQPRSFEFISKQLNGLDPIKAKEVLYILKEEYKIIEKEGMWMLQSKPQLSNLSLFPQETHLYLKKYMGYFDFLRTPHPLDYEWRNSTASLTRMLNRIQEICSIKDSILILGMPTLFATASLKDIPQKVTLLEKNQPILQGLRSIVTFPNRFKIIDADIFTVNPNLIEKHYCVVMDPPWYTEHFRHFIWLASNCVEIGGLIAISVPPFNTRPEIPNERVDWISFCHNVGLCIESLEAGFFEYAMPFFEFNAFRAAGITDVLPFWRKGDLMIFRKIGNNAAERPILQPLKCRWIEKEFRSVRIRILIDGVQQLEPRRNLEIKSIVKGDILPTVSRRDKIRDQANIWTSGNRVFKTNCTQTFLMNLDNIIKGHQNDKKNAIVDDFVNMISNLENKEYNTYLEWLYYEMERQIT